MKVLVTGGSGFIGSNFIKYLHDNSRDFNIEKIINVDKLTYAGRGNNLEHMNINKKYSFYLSDIGDKKNMREIFSKEKPNYVFNFAAESHVDKSIVNSSDFIKTNIIGALNLFEASLENKIKKFIQISTDEVYGSIKEGSFTEKDTLSPSNPYSGSKASADLLALSYFKTHNLPILITRSANNFGPYQFPEKLLPLFITNLIQGKKVPLMWSEENPALNVRDWLHVEDNARAIWFLSNNGENGQIYNIPGSGERTNYEITKDLLEIFSLNFDMVEKIPHRKGHDFRYSINREKLFNLGFNHKRTNVREELESLCNWYIDNERWWLPLKK